MHMRHRLLLGACLALSLAPAVAQARPGDLYVGDPGRHAVIRINHDNGNQRIVASGQHLSDPDSGDFAGKNKLFIADYGAFGGDGAIFRVNTKSGDVATVSKNAHFKGPTDVAVAPNGKLDA